MSIAEKSSARPTVATPRSAPKGLSHPPAEKVTTTELLAQESAQTKAALRSALDDLRRTVGTQASPARWIRQYPWASMGIALASGTAMGMACAKPSSRHSDSSRREQEAPPSAAAAQQRPGLAWLLLSPLFAAAGQAGKLAVTRLVMSLFEGMPPSADGETPDGAQPERQPFASPVPPAG